MNYIPGESVVYDRSLLGTFVKDLGEGQAIVRFGPDSRVVYLAGTVAGGVAMRILVDMDDVIASWGPEYDASLDAVGAAASAIPRKDARAAWDLRLDRTPEEKKIIEKIMIEPGFYARLKPISGAKKALKEMLADGNDVRIVTAPYISNPTCASDKLNWVKKHLGQSWAQRVILTTDKTLVRGDVLIDDKPEITGAMIPEWQHIVFGDYAYNRHLNGHRLADWGDWRSVVEAAYWPGQLVNIWGSAS